MLECTDIYGNALGDWVGLIAGQAGLNGNLGVDPCFCDPATDDFTLDAASPCAPEHSGGCGLIGAHPVGCGLTPVAPAASAVVTLAPCVPNPFNPTTALRYDLVAGGPVRLAVYHLDGRLVAILVDEVRPAGASRACWRGVDAMGIPVPSGAYLAVLESNGQRCSRRMVLLR